MPFKIAANLLKIEIGVPQESLLRLFEFYMNHFGMALDATIVHISVSDATAYAVAFL